MDRTDQLLQRLRDAGALRTPTTARADAAQLERATLQRDAVSATELRAVQEAVAAAAAEARAELVELEALVNAAARTDAGGQCPVTVRP